MRVLIFWTGRKCKKCICGFKMLALNILDSKSIIPPSLSPGFFLSPFRLRMPKNWAELSIVVLKCFHDTFYGQMLITVCTHILISVIILHSLPFILILSRSNSSTITLIHFSIMGKCTDYYYYHFPFKRCMYRDTHQHNHLLK